MDVHNTSRSDSKDVWPQDLPVSYRYHGLGVECANPLDFSLIPKSGRLEYREPQLKGSLLDRGGPCGAAAPSGAVRLGDNGADPVSRF